MESIDPVVRWLSGLHAGYPLVGILILLMFIDVLTGFCAAFITKQISSTICSAGMVRKVMIMMLVGMCAAIEPYCSDLPLSKLASMAFIVFEVTSIVENCARAGLPIPSVITDTLAKLKQVEKTNTIPTVMNVQVAKAEKMDIHTDTPAMNANTVAMRENTAALNTAALNAAATDS